MPARRQPQSGPVARLLARLPRPDHPGHYEGILVNGSRVLASGAVFSALALALGGGHFAIASLAAIPFLARLTHLVAPALVQRLGSARLAGAGAWMERAGLLVAATAGILRPNGWALPLFLAGVALHCLGQAIYDVSMASLHTEACAPGAFGRYSATKTRWASLSGLVLGIAASFAVDEVEHLGVAPPVARALSILTGAVIHLLVTLALRRLSARAVAVAREHAWRTLRRTPSISAVAVERGRGSWLVLPSTPEQWRVVRFAMAWGAATGISLRQGEAMAITVLNVSVGSILLLNALLLGAGVLGVATWGRLADRFGGKGLLSIALLALALDPVWNLGALLVHPALLIPGYALWGVFNSGWNIAAGVTLVRTTGPAADRIRTLALFNVAYGLGAGTTPLAGGLLLELLDARFSTPVAYGTLFALATTLRLLTYPLLRAMPAPPAERGRYVSAVVLRAVRRRVRRRGERITGLLKGAA